MCGGVRFKYDEKLESALSEMYTTEQLDLARTSGTVQSVFWQPRPVLPAIVDGDLRLFDRGIQGFLVQRGDQQRVYMLTLPPTPEYRALTGHDRMPALIDQDVVIPLDQGQQQVALGS